MWTYWRSSLRNVSGSHKVSRPTAPRRSRAPSAKVSRVRNTHGCAGTFRRRLYQVWRQWRDDAG
eukprot:5165868-Pyramimonas_sp.AAC.1